MKKKAVLFLIGMLTVVMAQARHPQFTRLATPGDPTFEMARR